MSSDVGSNDGNVSISEDNAYMQSGSNVIVRKEDVDVVIPIFREETNACVEFEYSFQ
ncbi:hypothetical protein Hsc_3227 [Herbaspirillum seropedicae]|nr:hypothetical protein Hsc_3227 [Herbaspirillum seropedicae]